MKGTLRMGRFGISTFTSEHLKSSLGEIND